LDSRGISYSDVDFILLTHAHLDHLGGIRELLEECQNARFLMPSIMLTREYQSLIFIPSIELKIFSVSEKIKSLFSYLKNSGRDYYGVSSTINQGIHSEPGINLLALSPTSECCDYFQNLYMEIWEAECRMRDSRDSGSPEPIVVKPRHSAKYYNYHSIVLLLEFNGYRALYCSDVEFADQSELSSESIYLDVKTNYGKIDWFKIPHHGSETGYRNHFWNSILDAKSHLKLTTYNHGTVLPKNDMIEELNSHWDSIYITTDPTTTYKKPKKAQKRMFDRLGKQINILTNSFGSVIFSSSAAGISIDYTKGHKLSDI